MRLLQDMETALSVVDQKLSEFRTEFVINELGVPSKLSVPIKLNAKGKPAERLVDIVRKTQVLGDSYIDTWLMLVALAGVSPYAEGIDSRPDHEIIRDICINLKFESRTKD